MLAADKLQLQSALKQKATALKEKEFQLHHNNLMTVGTQAAVLAALDVTLFVEFQPPPDSEWLHLTNISPIFAFLPRLLKFLYYPLITLALCSNITVVANTTILSLNSTSLALRGPDGSMMTATDGLYEERLPIFRSFYIGLAATVVSVIICVWLFLHWETSILCMSIAIYAGNSIHKFQNRINHRFDFDESQTVDFDDLFEAGSRVAIPNMKNSINRFLGSNRINGENEISLPSHSPYASDHSLEHRRLFSDEKSNPSNRRSVSPKYR